MGTSLDHVVSIAAALRAACLGALGQSVGILHRRSVFLGNLYIANRVQPERNGRRRASCAKARKAPHSPENAKKPIYMQAPIFMKHVNRRLHLLDLEGRSPEAERLRFETIRNDIRRHPAQ
jgi:hypothetical protein